MCAFAWCLFYFFITYFYFTHTPTHGICKWFVIKRKDIKEKEKEKRSKINWTSVKRETDGKQMQLQKQQKMHQKVNRNFWSEIK